MEFRLLGPLEVICNGRPIALGGIKQRATLGFLLLNANQVVPTSQLVAALWPTEDPPASARKMLQNAVWSLRRSLATMKEGDDIQLTTQEPGYVLRVDPELLDLTQFQDRIERARAADSTPEVAAGELRAALRLWRGNALSDLVESGISWPELSSVENLKLSALEDYFDAELACGRHQTVLIELSSLVEAEPLRERLCSQLMLALYRSGRHADALAAYGRLRVSLVDNLGLGPALQELQQSILNHEPTLAANNLTSVSALHHTLEHDALNAPVPPSKHPSSRRARLTIATVQVRLPTGPINADPAKKDSTLATVSEVIQTCFEDFGGTLAACVGSVSVVMFPDCDRQVEKAVSAALTVRDWFANDVDLKISLAHGSVLVKSDYRSVFPVLHGTLIDEGQKILSEATDNSVFVSAGIREILGQSYNFAADPTADSYEVNSINAHIEAEYLEELSLIQTLMDRAVKWSKPHIVTLLGETEKFVETFIGSVTTPRIIQSRVLPDDDGLELLVRTIAQHCNIEPEMLLNNRGTVDHLGKANISTTDLNDALTSWCGYIRAAAAVRPLVLVLRDLHLAKPEVRNAVQSLADPNYPLPLVVVVSAHHDLLRFSPNWGIGNPHSTSIKIDDTPENTSNYLRKKVTSTISEYISDVPSMGVHRPELPQSSFYSDFIDNPDSMNVSA